MSPAPFVSILVPCRNEERFIARALTSILANDYPSDRFEVVVADGMSTDRTRAILAELIRRHHQIILVENPRRITPTALNLALAHARGEIIIRMDAHAVYPANYVSTCVDYLRQTGADVVGGPINTLPGRPTFVAQAISLVLSAPFGVGGAGFRTSRAAGRTDTVPFGAYRREIFDRVGTFDERLPRNQDNELSSRILAAGGTIYMTPDLTATYFSPGTLRGFLRQAARTGWWNVVTLRVNPRAFRWRHFIPAIVVALGAALLLLSLYSDFARTVAMIFGGAYIVLAIVSAVYVARRAGAVYAVMLPPLFVALHVTYGLGSWAGMGRQLVAKRHTVDGDL